MENNDSRAWPKAPSSVPVPTVQPQQQGSAQRGIPPQQTPGVGSGPSSNVSQPHRYPSGPQNQLPPIQSPMSPKTDGSGSATNGGRVYASSIPHSSPTASAGMQSAPHSARPGSYTTTPISAHSQSSFAGQGVQPSPSAPANGPMPAVTATALPSITSPYVRSPTFNNAQSSSMTPIKGSIPQHQHQQQPLSHPASSPLHGPTGAAAAGVPHEMPPSSSAPYPSATTHTPVPRIQPPATLSSPGAKAVPPQMQSPHMQHTSSVPPPKQLQSPRVQRTASAQNTPTIPSIVQSSPRPMSHVSSAVSLATAAAPSSQSSAYVGAPRPVGASAAASMATARPPMQSGSVTVPAQPATSTAVQNGGSAPIADARQTQPAPIPAAAAPAAQQAVAVAEPAPRPLNVSDALSYLDLVKSQFQDRPEVYNQFLEIMKEFKSHAIDTPGVIERVSRLFYGSPSLIQGFNTFLPPGYRIECSDDPSEGVRVTTPSGSIIPDMHRRSGSAALAHPQSPLAPGSQAQSGSRAQQQQQQQHHQQQQQYLARDQYGMRRAGSSTSIPNPNMSSSQQMQSPPPTNQALASIQSAQGASAQAAAGSAMSLQGAGYSSATASSMGPAHIPARSPSAVGSPTMSSGQRSRQVPLEFNHAINYVNKIKMRFAAEPDRYKEFLEILQTYQKESRPIQEVYAQVQVLFSSAPDLLDEFKQFLPDTSESAGSSAGAGAAAGIVVSPTTGYARSSSGAPQGQLPPGSAQNQMGLSSVEPLSAGSRLPPVGNFTPVGATDPYATAPVSAGSTASSMPSAPTSAVVSGTAANQGGAGAPYDNKGMTATPTSGRKRRGVMSGGSQATGAPGSSKRRSKGAKADGSLSSGMMGDPQMQMQMQMQMQQATPGMGYGQHVPSQVMAQQPINPATATPDELAFFERVKRFIGQPSAYNEFLKLLNLYNQQVLDPKTLVERAESFIGDDQELFGWFKQFVGFDEQQQLMEDNRSSDEAIIDSILGPEPGPYMAPEEVAKTLRPARPKVQLSQCKSYGPSYRLLPEASAQAKCSGRDAMCYEVLNDRWASHPTWASEDTDFVHHKKNVYEEAMFRSEEDRHEMDIEIDTNLSVIRQLTPIAQQIEQMDPEKQMQLTLPENFWGMSEALPRRALRKVYDSNRALEIIKAMHTHPAVAIPIVLKRLKQKDEEWRRQRREFAKIWREIDAKNYYRALDHQGLTFKSADRKTISPKHLITEIETRRREQQNLAEDGGARSQSRKVASALRHRYQLEYQFSESTVTADVVNAILAHVGRQNSQFAPSEKEMMEKFFHELFGGLLGIESPTASSLPNGDVDSASNDAAQSANGEDGAIVNGDLANTGDEGNSMPNGSEAASPAPKANGVSSTADPSADTTNGRAGKAANSLVETKMEPSSNNAAADKDADGPASSGDAPMDIDEPSENANKETATAAATADSAKSQPGDESASKPSTPGLISSRSWIQIGPSKRDASAAPTLGPLGKNVSRAFYCNSSYYVFVRLFQILYERFNRLREISPECQEKTRQAYQAQSVANKLGMRADSEVLKGYDLENADYYSIFLELVDQFLQGQLETNGFDESMRVLFGINAYRILTVDKVVQAISKNIQNLISDNRCIDILELFTTLPPVHEQSPLRSHIAYRMKVEALVGADEHVFRIDYIYESQTMAVQLLRREDITLDEAVTEEERWAYYVDSYVLFEPTEGVGRSTQSRPRPYLSRHLHPDECDYVISSRSNLEIKIAVNTYKLCFLTGTEDIYANHSRRSVLTNAATQKAYDDQWSERSSGWHRWIAQEHQEKMGEGEELVEWWK